MSGTVIITKHSTSTNAPISDALAVGELAYSYTSDKLFIGETVSGAVEPVEIGGVLFTEMLKHARGYVANTIPIGVLTAGAALVAGTDKKLDNLKVDNLDFNGNTISSTNNNGNIINIYI